jgi:hypothetical protein
MSRGSARRALRGIAWLFPDGGPFKVPGADIIGVFPLELGGTGVAVGLSRMPSGMGMGMDIAVKVGPWVIAGTAMSAGQWAPRPRYIGLSQDLVARRLESARVGGRWRRGGLSRSLISSRCDGMNAARQRDS